LQLNHLEREACRGDAPVRADGDASLVNLADEAPLVRGRIPGFVGQGEERSDLHACRTEVDGFTEFLGCAVPAGEEERITEGSDALEIRKVALVVDRIAVLVDALVAGRGIVPAGRRSLDDPGRYASVGKLCIQYARKDIG